MILTRVALVSQADWDLQPIRQQLKNPLRFSVREFLTMDEVNLGLANFPLEILIVRIPYFSSSYVQTLRKIQSRFDKVGVITVAQGADPGARFEARQLDRHKLIEDKLEMHDLPKVIDKLLSHDPGHLRMHPRAKRKGEAVLIDSVRGRKFKVNFLDFAQMGACVQLSTKEPIEEKMRVQLHYPSSSEPGRMHRIESVVVWENQAAGGVGTLWNGPTQKVGIRFIAAL